VDSELLQIRKISVYGISQFSGQPNLVLWTPLALQLFPELVSAKFDALKSHEIIESA
jgi:hypothetical protein